MNTHTARTVSNAIIYFSISFHDHCVMCSNNTHAVNVLIPFIQRSPFFCAAVTSDSREKKMLST